MKRYPGQVWFLPPELEEGGDAKRRRHVLLTTCDEDEAGAFSFASTQTTEAKFGAAFLLVDPCVVELSARRREAIGYSYGIILTEASYSSSRRYQIIVPMDDVRVFEPAPDDILVSGCGWFEQVDPQLETVLISVSDIQSVFHRQDIERWTGAVVDAGTLNEIEEALKKRFEL
jgi:hypothetical protein